MDLRENLVVCIGSPMIDVTARVPHEFLRKYSLKPNNATAYNENHAKIFHDLEEYSPTYCIGGSITNTVRSVQDQMSLQGVCCYLGAIGMDDLGVKLREQLQKEGINVILEEVEGEETDKCAVLLSDDDRTFVTKLRASKCLRDQFFERDDVKHAIEAAKYYYLSAFFLRISPSIINKICRNAITEKKVFVFNIGATFLCSQYVQEFKQILPYVNVLIGNEEESRELADVLGYFSKDLNRICVFLRNKCYRASKDMPETLVIITRGPKPVILVDNKGVKEFDVPVLQMERNLNTSGAGDYFVGGFLANYIQNKAVRDCVEGGIHLSFEFIKRNSCFKGLLDK